jgi:hypothetical protein
VVSQFLEKPRMPNWVAVQRILRYLKGSPRRELSYKANGNLCIGGYTNVDWACSSLDRRFATSYLYLSRR